MIVSAGLTPAWQQILRFERLRPGEVNRAREVHRCASGKVLNVAIALAHLGAECEAVALVGGDPAELVDREFNSLGISRHWIAAHWSTRTCTTILDDATGLTTELVENAGPVTAEELERFADVYRQRVASARLAVLTGSLPAGAPSNYFRDLLRATPCPAILDIRGPELDAALECRPLVVKPNREELARTMGRDLASDGDLHSAMQAMNDRGAAWVIVTQGSGPALVSGAAGHWRIDVPRVVVVNPIGSGDCLAAGLAWGLADGEPPLDAICLGIAAAVENVSQLLPGRLDPQRVLARRQWVEAKPL